MELEPTYTQITIKIVIGFFLLWFITIVLGKTTIKQLTPFDFVSAIILSELLGNGIYEENIKIQYMIFAIFLWGALMILMEKLLLKYKKLRGTLEGNPSIIIRDGKIDRTQLKKARMNINQLMSSLRQSDVFSIREVAYAILEANGSISILKKHNYENVIKQDLQLPEQPTYLSTMVIIDGEVLEDNIKELGYSRAWLNDQLIANGYGSSKEILYADWLKNDGLYIIPNKTS
ncbi:DUF421 domain-containing protein [Evansella sp. AB-P1]|uniref:DUF421 domain-containing protein n=1 Tax=Evansella sp. AB-P1 TaxID=3037653 RepID=UPI00241D95B8|nr:DUF421 domain-containing protein [Evansella sp. AB-P1]MDG5787148.1 DUF421 domain-containing protein [Evansella sp. AB-P1]